MPEDKGRGRRVSDRLREREREAELTDFYEAEEEVQEQESSLTEPVLSEETRAAQRMQRYERENQYDQLLSRYRDKYRDIQALHRRYAGITGDPEIASATQILDAERNSVHQELLAAGRLLGRDADQVRIDILTNPDQLNAEYGVDLSSFSVMTADHWRVTDRMDDPRSVTDEQKTQARWQHELAVDEMVITQPDRDHALLVFDPHHIGQLYASGPDGYQPGQLALDPMGSIEQFRLLTDRSLWPDLIAFDASAAQSIETALRHEFRRRQCERFAAHLHEEVSFVLRPTHFHGDLDYPDCHAVAVGIALPTDKMPRALRLLSEGLKDYGVDEADFHTAYAAELTQIAEWRQQAKAAFASDLWQDLRPLFQKHQQADGSHLTIPGIWCRTIVDLLPIYKERRRANEKSFARHLNLPDNKRFLLERVTELYGYYGSLSHHESWRDEFQAELTPVITLFQKMYDSDQSTATELFLNSDLADQLVYQLRHS